jgi:hypothetical protein
MAKKKTKSSGKKNSTPVKDQSTPVNAAPLETNNNEAETEASSTVTASSSPPLKFVSPPDKENEMGRIAREAREFREQEAKRIAAEKEAARLAYEKKKKDELERIALQSGLSLEEAAKDREAWEKERTISPTKQSLLGLEDTNVSGKAKRLLEKEDSERKRVEEEAKVIEGRVRIVETEGEVEDRQAPLGVDFADTIEDLSELPAVDGIDPELESRIDDLEKALPDSTARRIPEIAEQPKNDAAEKDVDTTIEQARKEATEREAAETVEREAAATARKDAEEREDAKAARKDAAQQEAAEAARKEPEEREAADKARKVAAEREASEQAERESVEQARQKTMEAVRAREDAAEREASEQAQKAAEEKEAAERRQKEIADLKAKNAEDQAQKKVVAGHVPKIVPDAQEVFYDATSTVAVETPRDFPSADDRYAESLIVRKFDRSSIPRKHKKESSHEDDLLLHDRVQEATFEIPIEYTGNGFELLKEAEITMITSMPPSRVDGLWSGTLEGKSKLGSPDPVATGSFSLDYKTSPWSRISLGMLRGHELHHPMITIGGSLIRKGSVFGVTYYHNASFLHAMLLEHSMYALSFRHRFPNSRWMFTSELSRRQELSVSMSNSKLAGSVGWSIRRPKQVNVRVDVRPTISEHRRAHLFCQWKLGVWQVGASLVQSLHSEVASVGLGLRLYSTRGLEWVLSWNRGDSSVRIPIVVARGLQNVHLGQVLYFSMISFLVQEGLAEMWGWKSLKVEESSRTVPEYVDMTVKAREDAKIQVELMARQANRKKRLEVEKGGLVIHEAIYQVDGGVGWEATIPLQFWVSQSSVNLPATSKSQLLGFYDITASLKNETSGSKTQVSTHWWTETWNDLLDLTPTTTRRETSAKGPIPTLTVRYDFKGQSYSLTVEDHEELIIPNPHATRL